MRVPLCFSSKPTTTDEPIRPPPRSIAHARTASTADIYHPWVEPDPTTLKKAGCIFCDVSKEKGFAVVHEDEELIAFRDRYVCSLVAGNWADRKITEGQGASVDYTAVPHR